MITQLSFVQRNGRENDGMDTSLRQKYLTTYPETRSVWQPAKGMLMNVTPPFLYSIFSPQQLGRPTSDELKKMEVTTTFYFDSRYHQLNASRHLGLEEVPSRSPGAWFF